MALSFAKTPVNIKDSGGRRFRMVSITFDAAYVNGTGYTIAPADLNFASKIESLILQGIGAYQFTTAVSGVNQVVKAYTGANAEAANNEAGLNGLVAQGWAVGY